MSRDASPTGVPVVPRQSVLRFSAGTESPPWVKLSGAYLNTDAGAPNIRMRLKSLAHMPRPHRSEWSGEAISRIGGEKQLPDVAVLLDLLLEWASDERTRQRILVDNPQALYGFDPA